MFKKAFKVSAYNSIAGKDKKKLKKDVQKIFNSEVVETIFNDELNEKIFQNKLQGSKIVIYGNEKYPLFVDATSKGDYFPTLYLVFAYPDLIEGIEINPGVENFLAKGANLMWPGVKSPNSLGEFKKDDVRYIVDSNQNIIGLGALGSSSSEIKEGMQGIALYILHTLGDKLWEFGPKTIPEIALPAKTEKLGFTKQQEVVSLPKEDEKLEETNEEEKKVEEKKVVKKGKGKKKKQKQESDEEEEDEEENFEGLMQFASKSKQLQSTTASEVKADNALDQLLKQKKEIKEEINIKKNKGKKDKEEVKEEKLSDDDDKKKGKGKKKGKKDEGEESKGEIPTKIMDEYVYESFMNALKVSISDKDLPIDSSVFYSSHMLQCKREGIMIDMKCSSYKKIGKFFQLMSKQGIIEYKEAKKGAAPMIMKINRGASKLEQWESTISKAGKKNEEGEEKKVNQGESDVYKLQITELFRPKKDSFAKVFTQEKEHYTHEEIRNCVLQYIKNNSELCKMEKQSIILDPYLISQMQIVLENEEQEEEQKGEEQEQQDNQQQEEEDQDQQQSKKRKHKKQITKILREELFEKVEKSMLVYHKIQNLTTKKEDVKAGAFKGIQLTTEKAHNKNITKVIGLETYGFNVQNLANKFQLKFATAVSLHDLPGKISPGKEMIVQGNILQDLIDYFAQECGIERKYINLNDKLGKKQKKN